MPLWFVETLKDPIFQIAAVVFVAAFAMFWWMIFQSRKSAFSLAGDGKSADKTIISSGLPLTQEAKFQLVLENVIAINRRLDEIEKRLASAGSQTHPASGGHISTAHLSDTSEISRKLDAIYKVLSALSTKSE